MIQIHTSEHRRHRRHRRYRRHRRHTISYRVGSFLVERGDDSEVGPTPAPRRVNRDVDNVGASSTALTWSTEHPTNPMLVKQKHTVRRDDTQIFAHEQLWVGFHDLLHDLLTLPAFPWRQEMLVVKARGRFALSDALVARQRNLDTFEQWYVVLVLEREQMAVVVVFSLDGADGDDSHIGNTHQRHDHSVEQLARNKCCLLDDHDVGSEATGTCVS